MPVNARLDQGDHKAVINCVFDTPNTDGVRWPDPFTMIRTFVYNTRMSTTITPTSLTAGRGFGVLFVGSGMYTWEVPFAIAADGAITWTAGVSTNCGLATSTYYSRPTGICFDFAFQLVGDVHSARVHAMPIPSTSLSAATALTTLPVNVHDGLTATQRALGGRDFTIDSGTLRLVGLPVDSSTMEFSPSSTERSTNSWTGWVIWGDGMADNDAIVLSTSFAEEFFPTTLSSTALMGPNMAKFRAPDHVESDKVATWMERAVSWGLAAYHIVKNVWNGVESALKVFGSPQIAVETPVSVAIKYKYAQKFGLNFLAPDRREQREEKDNHPATTRADSDDFQHIRAGLDTPVLAARPRTLSVPPPTSGR